MSSTLCIAFFVFRKRGMKTLEENSVSFIKYQYALKMLETEVGILLEDFSHRHGYNPVEHIKSRIKTEKSIRHKLEEKNLLYTERNILLHVPDVVGLRIVVSFLSDVYDIVSTINNSHNIIIKKRKDYIANPKESGYTSYHLIVLVPIYLENHVEYVEAEIQIRTIAMDFWASLDHKIRYKFPNEIPADVSEAIQNYAKDIKEMDKKMYQLNKIMNSYQENL